MLSERGQAVFDRLVANHTELHYDKLHLTETRQSLNLSVPIKPEYWQMSQSQADTKWSLEISVRTNYGERQTYLRNGILDDTVDYFFIDKIINAEGIAPSIMALSGTIDVTPLRSTQVIQTFERQRQEDNILDYNERLSPIDALKYYSQLNSYEELTALSNTYRTFACERPTYNNCIVSEKELNTMLMSVGIETNEETKENKSKSSFVERE